MVWDLYPYLLPSSTLDKILKWKSGWSLDTYIHIYHHHQFDHHHDKLHDFKINSGWSQETYIHVLHHPQPLQYFHPQKYHRHYNGERNNGRPIKTDKQNFHQHSYWNNLSYCCGLHSCWLYTDQVRPNLLLLLMVSGNELCWERGINDVGKWHDLGEWGTMASVTRDQQIYNIWCCYWRVRLCSQNPHGDCLLSVFLGLQWAEARLIR